MPQDEEVERESRPAIQPGSELRDYLAEERTFLAWIRTILGVMGFGILVARIDRFFFWFGTSLVVIASVLSLLAVRRHSQMVDELNHPEIANRRPSTQGVVLAAFLAAAGLAMTLYLIMS